MIRPEVGEYTSWSVLEDGTIAKHMDMSAFKNFGSGVDRRVIGFFLDDDLDMPDSVDLVYICDDEEYSGRINRDKYGRYRIFWNTDLQEHINCLFDYDDVVSKGEFPYMRFEPIGKYCYDVAFFRELSGPPTILSDVECELDRDIVERMLSLNDDRSIDAFIGEMSLDDALPVERKVVVAKAMVRNPRIAGYVKRRDGYRCQICGAEGFLKRDGSLYAEAHHLLELGKQADGERFEHESLMICVCPTCHRILHYGDRSELIKRLKHI